MTPRYDVLPASQAKLLPALAPLRDLGFVLYGGTAIALQVGHRVSIDFDFFSDQPLDRRAIIRAVPLLRDAAVIQDQIETWTLLGSDEEGGSPVKISFFGNLRFGRVGQPWRGDSLILASLDDLLGHKLKVLLQRVEAKDYLDIASLLRFGLTLERGIGAAIALFSNFPACEALKALVYFSDGDLGSLPNADRVVLIDHVDRFSSPTSMPIVSARLIP